MSSVQIIHADPFAVRAANLIEEALQDSIAERGVGILSLCGGGTPKPVYQELSRRALPWEQIKLTFGDERCVPPDHPDSNYRMVQETLLNHIEIPTSNVLRMKGELEPEAAAEDYSQALQQLAPEGGVPVHDVILLGMGGDGHTASLFPDTAALQEQEKLVVANYVAKLEAWRLTMTYPLINAGREVFFLVNDHTKHSVVREVIDRTKPHPAAKIAPSNGQVLWLLGYSI